MTSEKTDLLQLHILNKVNELKGYGDYNRYDLFLNTKTLRLRKRGVDALNKLYDHYSFDIQGVKSGQLLSLYKKMEYPYYIGKKFMILYSEQDAFIMKLGGFDAWVAF